MKLQHRNQWHTIGFDFVNRFCLASFIMLALAAFLSLGEHLTR